MSGRKRRERRSTGRRVRPADVTTHQRLATPVQIRTLRELLASEPWFAHTAGGSTAFAASAYVEQCHAVLAQTIAALARRAAGAAPPNECALDAAELDQLRHRRAQWLEHLKHNLAVLLRAPPSSGGDTARYTLGTGLWLLVCHAHCVVRALTASDDAGGGVWAFDAARSRFLTRNALVLDALPVLRYPLSLLVQSVFRLHERAEQLDAAHDDYMLYVRLLEHRAAHFVCSAGAPRDAAFDAPRWLEPASGLARDASQPAALHVVNTDFVCQSMIWFLTLRHLADAHEALGAGGGVRPAPELAAVGAAPAPHRLSVAATRALRWYPSAALCARVRQFFLDYAAGMKDDSYESALRASQVHFLPLPCDAFVYRLYEQADIAVPRNVLSRPTAHRSPTALEYAKFSQFSAPPLRWLHDDANWRAGDASIRSASLERLGLVRQLAALFVVHQFFASSRIGVNFRRRFVLFQRSHSFFVSLVRAKRNGWPFIVQQWGTWSVVVPHRKSPDEDAHDIERSLETLSTRDAHATERFVHARRRQTAAESADHRRAMFAGDLADNDDDDADDDESADAAERALRDADDASSESGSYSYTYSYDSESDSDDDAEAERLLYGAPAVVADDPAEQLAQRMSRLALEAEEDEAGADEALRAQRRVHGAQFAPQAAAREQFVRAYDCETFFDAFTLWAVALLHVNDGCIDRRNLTDMFVQMFGWSEA